MIFCRPVAANFAVHRTSHKKKDFRTRSEFFDIYANAIFSQVGSLEAWENCRACRSRNLAEVKVTTAVHGVPATARNIGCDRFLGRIRSRSRHFRERPRLVRAAVWFLSVDGRRPLSRRAKGENGVGQNYT